MTTSTHNQTFQTGHVGLNVSGLDRSKRFYTEAFGLQILGESHAGESRFVFLGRGGALVLTLWEQSDGRFEKGLPGLHHLSFQVETIEEVKRVEQRLKALNARFVYDGIAPHAEGKDSGGIFFEDPDGIRLEVFSPTGAGAYAAPVAQAPT